MFALHSGVNPRIRESLEKALQQLKESIQKSRAWLVETSQRLRLAEKLAAFKERLPEKYRQKIPARLDLSALSDLAENLFRTQNANFWGKLFTVIVCMFFLADILALGLSRFIKDVPPNRGARGGFDGGRPAPNRGVDSYSVIWTRNLFNSRGLIPGEGQPNRGGDPGGEPVRTTLPFNLIGTLIMRDELRSLATIEDRTAAQVFPVRATDEIPGKARIIKVEGDRVIFLNLSANRREFIDLPADLAVSNIRVQAAPSKKAPGIEQLSETQFSIQRSTVDAAFKDLNKILTEARCIPNFKNGAPAGFRCFQIVKGSIYDQLGMKENDVVCGLNGAPMNDITKAVEQLSELKTASRVEICIERDGVAKNYAYDIR